MSHRKIKPVNYRKYIRLDTVFPVQFRLETSDGKTYLSDWLQGFTNNVSSGGICLSINNLNPELFKLLKDKQARLSLEIDIPVSRKPVPAHATIIWVKDIFGDTHKYLVGLNYEYISPTKNTQLMRYAWFKKLFFPVVLALVGILVVALSINSYINIELTRGNKLLIEKLSVVLKESHLAQQKIEEIAFSRHQLQTQLKTLESQMQSALLLKAKAESQNVNIEASNLKEIARLNGLIFKLAQERAALKNKLTTVVKKEDVAVKELSQIDQKKVVLEKANFDKMYQWLKLHQNSRTGLVMSFEGDKDIANWSFTYDLALLVQTYSYFGDFDRARKILNFFAHNAKRENGWFLNAYYVNDGGPAEFIMHSGPNLWLGLAIMQYTQMSQDKSYLDLAQSIGQTIINIQKMDSDGGIKGGPTVDWYATEHNLDAYAFFNMLAKVTGRKVYSQAAQTAMDWMIRHTYDRQDLPVKRGKGDSTIATDTYAWSIAAIGPQKLKDLGMNPDQIMDFVEEACSVETNFLKPGGENVKIKGFDFAPQAHTARGGVVSSEWTAQMVVSYKIMEDYYVKKGDLKKAASYADKAQLYLSQLSNMIISSSSPSGQGEGCLPYATQDYVDTGHGWKTPKGSHTGSVSGTAYALFAYYGFNPLELK